MPDYIYLLENRLSADQRNALSQLREAAHQAGTILFLTGDAVRDLTSGHAVRELEISVHGNALKLKKTIVKLGGKVWGEDESSRSVYLCFPGTVRVDVISTHRVEYAKPGKPVFHPASIQEDLRRRDFTVNAMAISLNEGSFGLLMDPLNGAADIESRTLRLVSNYGFLEEPSLLIRATRYRARLGWDLDAKTLTRYENAKSEGVIEYLSSHARSQELEQIGHEEDGLKVLRSLEAEGWMKVLYPAWTSAKADEEKLKALHDLAVDLLLQGVHADMSAAQMQLLTAKLSSREVSALKKLMLRPGFVEEWNSLDALASGFARVLQAKQNATPSASFKLFTSYDPEAVLWLGFTSKVPAILERFNQFLKVWPEARQRTPHALMQEMRITPELAAYSEIVQAIFLELIDGRLTTPEEMRAYLEPHSPPAPPPQVIIKRPRAKRGAEAKLKAQAFDEDEESEESLATDEELEGIGGDEEEIDLGLIIPKVDLDAENADEAESTEDDLEAAEPASALAVAMPPARKAPVSVPVKTEKKATPSTADKLAKAGKTMPLPPLKPVAEVKAVPAGKSAAKDTKPPVSAAKAKTAPGGAKVAGSAKKKAAPAVSVGKKSKLAKPAAKIAQAALAHGRRTAKKPAKIPVKARAKTPTRTVPAKSKPSKRKPVPVVRAKLGKKLSGARPSRPAMKKPFPKSAKKR
jgi:tRNA nucleotidyltransferase/poly(A) polymerase